MSWRLEHRAIGTGLRSCSEPPGRDSSSPEGRAPGTHEEYADSEQASFDDYRLEDARAQKSLNDQPFHQWTLPDGSPWTTFYRCGAGFLLRFPRFADFHVSEDGCDTCCIPVPGTSEEICHHLYLNQVLPLIQGRQGKLVFHASAVALGGRAIAFLGASGRGKSTLAAAFTRAGMEFLADDAMVLESTEVGYRVLPSHPSIRLRLDTQRALIGSYPEDLGGPLLAGKLRIEAGRYLSHCDEPRPLFAAFFLGEGDSKTIDAAPLQGAEAVTEWVRHTFILDFDDQAWLALHFEDVATLSETVTCYRLDYPRRFEDLDKLRAAIVGLATSKQVGA